MIYFCVMIFLILSIFANAAIYPIFKLFDQKGIQLFPAIVFNYMTALTCGILVIPEPALAFESAIQWPIWAVGGIALGTVFISIFYVMGISSQKVGVGVTTIASKMSLALAVLLFAWFDPSQFPTPLKLAAIAMALVGVILSSLKTEQGHFSMRHVVFPLLILIGSTVIDFGVAYFQAFTTNENELSLYSCLSFGTAGLIGTLLLIVQLWRGRIRVHTRDVAAGIGLGIVNYGSIYFLVKAYNAQLFSASTTLPINNLAVVMLGAGIAYFVFKERFSRKNILGLGCCLIALILLVVSD
jgi:drug/metabolite transporter (DMT)-like permease